MTEETAPGARVLARTPRPTPADVADALASAFLSADEWSPRSLVGAGAYVLGVRRRWLAPVVDDVLRGFVRAPVDAPRLLAARINDAPAFREAMRKAKERGAATTIAHRVVVPVQSRDAAGPLPRIDDLAGLAVLLDLTAGELDWYADNKHWNRRARSGRLHLHRYEWRARPGRVPRLLEIPEKRLRRAQRTLLEGVLALIPSHDAAHGFIPGRSAITGAARHVDSDVVVCLDLSTFFARVTAGRIYGTLRRSGFSEPVAHTITGVCTNAVPPRVLAAMPQGGSSDERFALRRALAAPHLPQGAPSSPMLANLAIRRLDSRLSGWAAGVGAIYTRYADDLAFSGGEMLAKRPEAFVRGAQRIIDDEGHSVNIGKTRIRRRGVRQAVTGIVVNQHTNVSRSDYDRLKATIHNCVVHGPSTQNHAHVSDFRAHLLGRISWVESVNADRGRKLRDEFLHIRW